MKATLPLALFGHDFWTLCAVAAPAGLLVGLVVLLLDKEARGNWWAVLLGSTLAAPTFVIVCGLFGLLLFSDNS